MIAKNAFSSFNKPFAKRLRALIENEGGVSPRGKVTQEELAAEIRKHKFQFKRQTISMYINGKSAPDMEKFKIIADYFNVSYDYLLGESDSLNRDNIDIAAKTGLSDASIEALSDFVTRDEANSFTLTVNALLENDGLLGAMSRYLYYSIDKSDIEPFKASYRYLSYCKDSKGANYKDFKDTPLDAVSNYDAIDNDMYKRVLLLEVEEQLIKLMQSEENKTHFSELSEV
jgi:transcriptional regulator with XRE-family HTH domain